MTAASPLHVSTSPNSLSTSSPASPPTPNTPKSATSMQPDSQPQSSSSQPEMPSIPSTPLTSPDNTSKTSLSHVEGNGIVQSKLLSMQTTGSGVDEVQEIALPEMKISPPEVLPPSPPYTEPGGHSEPEGLVWKESQDIASREGSFHELEFSYSEPTPIDPYGPSAVGSSTRHGGISQDRLTANSSQNVPEHPLRLDVHPPSPPPWEVIEPPATNNALQGELFPEAISRDDRLPKHITSRPLIPHSSYYFGPPPLDSAYGSNPIGQIGFHHPREIVRVERDYSGGEVIQFAPVYPLELEGRITPTQFLETINSINELLISAHSLRHSLIDNLLSFFTLQLSRLVWTTHYEKEMKKVEQVIDDWNRRLYNQVGLNILWPRKVGFLFLEIEYY
ncbi:Golgin subfamily A member 7/ERF4 family-domain-containing protein [Abortiporus biennis]|nr:Golgin subfamily A member 7/ERF4 family-domain-containing protein [Abortiporus biennis]